MRERRDGRPDRELTNGPGKLCRALAIGSDHDGVDLCSSSSTLRLLDDGYEIDGEVRTGPRIGISRAVDRPWRFRLPSD
jgi:DNA-3-methyladenine glycosylase